VLCVSGDGALLMNLGSLVTVAACAPRNLVVCVLDNRMYEVTGGQQLPLSHGQALDYGGLAKSVGFEHESAFGELAEWKAGAERVLALPGPSLLRLAVHATPREYLKSPTPPMAEQLSRFQAALLQAGLT
jgi:sulfopyruvate decarboxylase subunit beta